MGNCGYRPQNWFGPIAPAGAYPEVQPQNRTVAAMNPYSTLDPESFQKLLASAFVLQESLMGTQSLSAILEVRHLIATGELDVNGALHLIADHARNVANATGVAIGLLKRDNLVYSAGSGSAVAYVGRHVMATLSVPAASTGARGEILRVENTETDARIEAAICRQFGAKSLLILPIYHDRDVMGVLQIFFGGAHVFQDREVHTYQLMAKVVGEAMSHADQLETLATELSAMPQAAKQITPQMQKFLASPADTRAMCQTPGAAIAKPEKMPSRRANPVVAATMMTHQAMRIFLHRRPWKVAGAALVIVLAIASWIAYSHRRPGSPLHASARQTSNAITQQLSPVSTKPVTAHKNTSSPQTAPIQIAEPSKAGRSTLERVRVGDSHVDYVSEDVTVRYFTPKPELQRVRVGDHVVDYISADVTVRHFTLKPAVMPPR